MLREKAPRSTKEAALWIVQHEPTLFRSLRGAALAEDTIRKKLPTVVGTGLQWPRLGCVYRIILTGSGKGTQPAMSSSLTCLGTLCMLSRERRRRLCE